MLAVVLYTSKFNHAQATIAKKSVPYIYHFIFRVCKPILECVTFMKTEIKQEMFTGSIVIVAEELFLILTQQQYRVINFSTRVCAQIINILIPTHRYQPIRVKIKCFILTVWIWNVIYITLPHVCTERSALAEEQGLNYAHQN